MIASGSTMVMKKNTQQTPKVAHFQRPISTMAAR